MSDSHGSGHPIAGYVGLVVIWVFFAWVFSKLGGYSYPVTAVFLVPLLAFGVWVQVFLTRE